MSKRKRERERRKSGRHIIQSGTGYCEEYLTKVTNSLKYYRTRKIGKVKIEVCVYICIYNPTQNRIHLDFQNRKNVNPRCLVLTAHTFFLCRSFPFPSRFPHFHPLWKCYKHWSLGKFEAAAESAFGIHLWIRRGKTQIGQWISNKPSVASACIYTYIPSFPSCLLRCRLAPMHKAITTRRWVLPRA